MQRLFGPPLHPIPIQPPVPFQGPFMPMGGMPPAVPFSGQAAQSVGAGGGFLSRLFSGGVGGGVPSSGINFGTILSNTQRVLGLTQQAVPIVRQYGPLVRNLPAIWRIMRETDSSEPTADVSGDIAIPVQSSNEQPATSLNQTTSLKPSTIDGMPLPKLYI